MSVGIQAAEQTVRLAIRAGGEIKRVGRPSIVVVAAEPDGPQPVDEDRLPLGVAHLAKKLAALRIEGVEAKTRIVSKARIRLDSGKSVRSFKGIICVDISEFESFSIGAGWCQAPSDAPSI